MLWRPAWQVGIVITYAGCWKTTVTGHLKWGGFGQRDVITIILNRVFSRVVDCLY